MTTEPTDLCKPHEAATPAPWDSSQARYADGDTGYDLLPPDWPCNGQNVAERMTKADADLIVALRNAYAEGRLIEVEAVRQLWEAVDEWRKWAKRIDFCLSSAHEIRVIEKHEALRPMMEANHER